MASSLAWLAAGYALWGGGSAATPRDGREATSLAGVALMRPAFDESRAAALEGDVAAARAAWDAEPTEENAIWLGRRLGYAGRYRESIEAFSEGLRPFPDSYRLRRHRGHRSITVREFDRAIADLSRAWALVRDKPDAVEPDGQPTPGVPPRSTDKTSILYHLGLAHYLKGDFDAALAAFQHRRDVEHVNDDNLVASLHWEYMALRRLGHDADARDLASVVRDGMDVRENHSYYALVRMYAGLATPVDIARSTPGDAPADIALRYGLANRILYDEHDPVRARREFEAILADSPERHWPAFGFIAAEADLARLQDPSDAAR